ncbi:hypothetical protein [Mycobacterium deserti]|uniref:Secreted protein n=1 Tax=Mycobacterium deserti TaxID=2978347 RepID=A0ABT2MCF0_9MYCO|nr:hypothetical protein [Mycobacterium deserti]MCT7659945.1 hypothetical protein [Mycobacterium deserti]
MKKIGEAAIVGALAVTALGVGAGVANADEAIASSAGNAWAIDRPDWDDDWRGPKWDDRRWDGPRYWNGPQYGNCAWVPPAVSMWVPPAVC